MIALVVKYRCRVRRGDQQQEVKAQVKGSGMNVSRLGLRDLKRPGRVTEVHMVAWCMDQQGRKREGCNGIGLSWQGQW